MDPNTSDIYRGDESFIQKVQKKLGRKLVPITEKQAIEMEKLPKRRRLFLLKQQPCPCLSGKSFKKCCWKKYKKEVQ